MIQKSDIVRGGIPPRHMLDAVLTAPHLTDVPQAWVVKLIKARDQLDASEEWPDGSEGAIFLIDAASDIEEQAIRAFNV